MSDFTLRLEDDWDLHVNDDGNLPKTFTAQGIAQNVANAFRLFTNDAYFFTDKGILHDFPAGCNDFRQKRTKRGAAFLPEFFRYYNILFHLSK